MATRKGAVKATGVPKPANPSPKRAKNQKINRAMMRGSSDKEAIFDFTAWIAPV